MEDIPRRWIRLTGGTSHGSVVSQADSSSQSTTPADLLSVNSVSEETPLAQTDGLCPRTSADTLQVSLSLSLRVLLLSHPFPEWVRAAGRLRLRLGPGMRRVLTLSSIRNLPLQSTGLSLPQHNVRTILYYIARHTREKNESERRGN